MVVYRLAHRLKTLRIYTIELTPGYGAEPQDYLSYLYALGEPSGLCCQLISGTAGHSLSEEGPYIHRPQSRLGIACRSLFQSFANNLRLGKSRQLVVILQ